MLHINRLNPLPILKSRFVNKLFLSERLNILRAAVLGANDGIISTAGVVVGVAGAHQGQFALMLAGLSAMLAGAFSMGGGEFVSVSAQRDTQRATRAKQEAKLNLAKDEELESLTQHYIDLGLTPDLAKQVCDQLMAKDGLNVTLKNKYNLDVNQYFNPWHAALSSFCSFIVGALLPFLMIVFVPYPQKVLFTVLGVVVALAFTGYTSATMGGAHRSRAALRNVCVGLLTMGVTYFIGSLIG